MAEKRIEPEDMAALYPLLFRVSQPKPLATFAEQHAQALAAFNTRPSRSPAFCGLVAARMAEQASKDPRRLSTTTESIPTA